MGMGMEKSFLHTSSAYITGMQHIDVFVVLRENLRARSETLNSLNETKQQAIIR